MSAARDQVVAFAQSKVGLTAPDPDFLSLVAPGDEPARQAEIATESDCGLTLLGIQEGVFAVPARGPYKNASAFELVYQRVGGDPWHETGAFVLPTQDAVPDLGDGVEYGASAHGVAHMETVIGRTLNGNHLTLSCVAGGEKNDAGKQTVKLMTRNLVWSGTRWIDLANSRPIIGIIDADKMADKYGLLSDTAADR